MKARIRRLTKFRELNIDGKRDAYFFPEMYEKGVHEFVPVESEDNYLVINWYTCLDEPNFNYHISWLIPVEENEHS